MIGKTAFDMTLERHAMQVNRLGVKPIEALDFLVRVCRSEGERDPGEEYREALGQAVAALRVLRRYW